MPEAASVITMSSASRRSLRSVRGRSSSANAPTPATIEIICAAWPGMRKFS